MKEFKNQSTILTATKSAVANTLSDYAFINQTEVDHRCGTFFSFGIFDSSRFRCGVAIFIIDRHWRFFVTAAANALNQVFEKDFDILMVRTSNRPLAAGRMRTTEAILFAGVEQSCWSFDFGIFQYIDGYPWYGFIGLICICVHTDEEIFYFGSRHWCYSRALPVLIGFTAFKGH